MKTKGQVWIETVLYTLIGLSLIGLVLAYINPKINDAKDKAVVEQTINSLNQIDEKITAVLQAPGNVRPVEFTFKRGELYINSSSEEIIFVINDLVNPYSEPGVDIPYGKITVRSDEGAKSSSVSLKIKYDGINIKYSNNDIDKKFTPASIPYKFSIENLGVQNNLATITINEVSGR